MNYFVKREGGVIVGAFRRPQDDTEINVDGHPIPIDSANTELIAFMNPPKTLDERKRDYYNDQGLTQGAFMNALMQQELDGDNKPMDVYKASRTLARGNAEFPK